MAIWESFKKKFDCFVEKKEMWRFVKNKFFYKAHLALGLTDQSAVKNTLYMTLNSHGIMEFNIIKWNL